MWEERRTYDEISNWLKEGYDITITVQGLYQARQLYKKKYGEKFPVLQKVASQMDKTTHQNELTTSTIEKNKIAQNQETQNKQDENQMVGSTPKTSAIFDLLDDSPKSIKARQDKEKEKRFSGKKW